MTGLPSPSLPPPLGHVSPPVDSTFMRAGNRWVEPGWLRGPSVSATKRHLQTEAVPRAPPALGCGREGTSELSLTGCQHFPPEVTVDWDQQSREGPRVDPGLPLLPRPSSGGSWGCVSSCGQFATGKQNVIHSPAPRASHGGWDAFGGTGMGPSSDCSKGTKETPLPASLDVPRCPRRASRGRARPALGLPDRLPPPARGSAPGGSSWPGARTGRGLTTEGTAGSGQAPASSAEAPKVRREGRGPHLLARPSRRRVWSLAPQHPRAAVRDTQTGAQGRLPTPVWAQGPVTLPRAAHGEVWWSVRPWEQL